MGYVQAAFSNGDYVVSVKIIEDEDPYFFGPVGTKVWMASRNQSK